MIDDHMIPSRAKHRSNYRRLVLPAATLFVAGLIFLWQRQVAPQRAGQVQAFVERLVAEAPSNASIAGTEPIITTTVRARLAELQRQSVDARLPVATVVDRATAGADNATHVATISIDPARTIILRMRNDGGTIVIVGVEVPLATAP